MEPIVEPAAAVPARLPPTLADYGEMLLWPKQFFARPLALRETPLFHVAVVSLGVANVFDRLAGSRDFALVWWKLWAIALVVGAASGYLSMWIGGAIYGLRVDLSGGTHRGDDAADMFVHQSAIVALPVALMSLAVTAGAARPGRALEENALWMGLVTLVALIWSFYVSYQGVMVKFQPVRWKAVIWFIVAPVVFLVALGAAGA